MRSRVKLSALVVIALGLMTVFMVIKAGGIWEYVLPRRGIKLLAIVVTGAAIGFSTLVFQTVTNNRILTPSIIGLDALYLLVQTVIVFGFGSATLTMMDSYFQFILSVGCMVLFALGLYQIFFKREGNNIYFLLLVGIVFGTLFGSLSTFMQVLIDPNEFMVVQDRMFASFNNVNTDLLNIALIIFALVFVYCMRYVKYLDVISLGKEHALNLGIPYDAIVKKLLIAIAILISVATALVGPITFLGLLVVNVTYEFFRSYKHSVLIPGSILISIIALVGGQMIVERVFTFSTTLSVIINLVGGVYFLYLILRENKSW